MIIAENTIEVIGAVAGALTTAAFVPQAWRTFRTRSVGDISLLMYSMLVVGIVLWLVYGVLKGSWPLILANGITLLFAGTVLVLRLVYGRSTERAFQRSGKGVHTETALTREREGS